jgi:hypothetical protein
MKTASGWHTATTLLVDRRFWTVLLVGSAALLYLWTLDDGLRAGELLGGDLITHQFAQVEARPSNAPGYPLYTMGGWLWFHGLRELATLAGIHGGTNAAGELLAPNPLPILSSYSTLWALCAVGLLFLLLCQFTSSSGSPQGRLWLAVPLTIFYIVTYFFWYYATTTEQYSSAIAQTLLIIYLYDKWSRQTPGRTADRLLLLMAFVSGVSLAHMLTVAFIVPPLVAVILWQQPALLRRPRLILGAILAAALPLLSYFYVYSRGAGHPEWWGAGDWNSVNEWFWAFVSTSQGRDELMWGLEPGRGFWGNGFPELIWLELTPILVVAGLAGFARSGPRWAGLFWGTTLIYLAFSWFYRYGNWFQVILPLYPLLLIGSAILLAQLDEALAPGRWHRLAMTGLLVLLIGWRFAGSLPRADSSYRADDDGLRRAAILLDQPLPADAGLFSATEISQALNYLISIWGIRPELQVVSSEQAADHLRDGRPVAAERSVASLLLSELPPSTAFDLSQSGPDWMILTPPGYTGNMPVPPPMMPLATPIGTEVTLTGYRLQTASAGAPPQPDTAALDLALAWSLPSGRWPEGLSLSLRPTIDGAMIPAAAAGDGAVVQHDFAGPALFDLLAEDATRPELVDYYRLPAPAGANGVTAILYRQLANGGFENLAVIPLGLTQRGQ